MHASGPGDRASRHSLSRAEFLRIGGTGVAGGAASLLVPRAAGAATGQVDDTGDADIRAFGAVGDGVADDTAAIQAAIDASQGVYFPTGVYRCTATIRLRNGSRLVGEASGSNPGLPGSQLNFSSLNYTRAVQGPPIGAGAGHGVTLSNLWIKGAAEAVPEIEGFPSFGFYAQSQNSALSVVNCLVSGFTYNCWLEDVDTALLLNVGLGNAVRGNLVLWGGCSNVRVLAGRFTVPNEIGRAAASAALSNIWLLAKPTGGPRAVTVIGCAIDEVARLGQTTPPATVRVDAGEDIVFSESVVWVPVNDGSGYGVKIGAGSRRVALRDIRVEPYERDANHRPISTVLIDGAAEGTVLTNLTTDANGGGDIVDNAVDTVWVNVNGVTKFRGGVAPGAVAALPPPAAATRGQLLRLNGSGDRSDQLYLGIRSPDGTYAWEQLIGRTEFDVAEAAIAVRELRLPATLHGLQNWYDLSQTADYAAVPDLSGNARTTDHRYGNLDPEPRTDPNLFGGRRFARFDGANNRALVASTAVTGARLTVMVVGRVHPGAGGVGRLFALTDNKGPDFSRPSSALVYHSAANTLTSYRNALLTSSSVTDGTPFVLLVTYDGAVNRHQTSEAGASGGAASTGNFAAVDLIVGGGKQLANVIGAYSLACDIAEVAVWDRALSADDLAALVTYARRRWAL